ncbi:MAG: hypothetical protein HGA85_04005 [Nanoarchaeota archaeon]|nr:hypothetical protein [Nanoarchaeota archaeon]
MDTRKIQRSGTTYYLYLPAPWCREHNLTTDSVVHLSKSSKGDLIVEPRKGDSTLPSLKIQLDDTSQDVVNKFLIAAYISPVREFNISLAEPLSPDQILFHKTLLGGLELVDIEDNNISCHTTLALSDPDILLSAMIKKILSIVHLMKKEPKHELIQRYEDEIDKSNLLINKAIMSALMYKKDSKIRHINLFYIGMISRSLEQIGDILITIDEDPKLLDSIDTAMESLLLLLETMKQSDLISFIKETRKLSREVKDLNTYKRMNLHSLLSHIAEILCDWVIVDLVEKGTK